MDYCRVDFYDGDYVYLENDTIDNSGEFRASWLLCDKWPIRYKRIKRMKNIPVDKMVNTFYHKTP